MPSRTSHNFLSVFKRSVCLLAISLIGSAPSGAQNLVLHLQNGDRITGRFVSESTNAVVLATPFSDHVSIPTSMIERREALPAPAAPVAATNLPATNAPSVKAPLVPATGVAGELVPTNKPAITQAAPNAKAPQVKTNLPPPSLLHKFLSEWRGEAQLGANFGFSTADREAFTGHIKLTENHALPENKALRNILDYDVAYGKTDGVLSDNRMEGTWKAEVDLGKRFLVYNEAGGGYDDIQGIDLQYHFGPGVGYKWITLSNFVFRTELGADYQEQYFVHDHTTSRYSLRVAEDLWWQISPKIRWDEKAEFYPELDRFGEYRVRLETNLSYLLKENLTLTLNVIDLYDTAVPAASSKNDLQIRSLLGIKF